MNQSVKTTVGIVGAAGYTGGECLRILDGHPEVRVIFAHSRSNAGKKVSDVHKDLIGRYLYLHFTDQVITNVDVVFLCLGHGQSEMFLSEVNLDEKTVVIDLSQDFRVNDQHGFVYGLSEVNQNAIVNADKIANPGCFATAIELALYPFSQAKHLPDEIHVTAITGSTGAGFKPTESTHFTWRNSNLSVYKAFEHQHLHEINQLLKGNGWDGQINMIPLRGNFSRGIIASIHFKCELDYEEALNILETFYDCDDFVHIVKDEPDMKRVVNTNNCIISVNKHNGYVHLVSVIDNLVKGAAGQAVQNMNLIQGWDESLGLKLKPVAF